MPLMASSPITPTNFFCPHFLLFSGSLPLFQNKPRLMQQPTRNKPLTSADLLAHKEIGFPGIHLPDNITHRTDIPVAKHDCLFHSPPIENGINLEQRHFLLTPA
jgi:hypothetical protein